MRPLLFRSVRREEQCCDTDQDAGRIAKRHRNEIHYQELKVPEKIHRRPFIHLRADNENIADKNRCDQNDPYDTENAFDGRRNFLHFPFHL